ncbi:MAG TPA: hypothetical protein VII52_07205 [Gemmatimonadaceae bacterium]
MLATTLELIVRMQRVQSFLAAAPKLTEGLDVMQHSFDAALTSLVSLSAVQAALSQAESAAPRHLKECREQLRADHMRPIAEIARQHHLPCPPMPPASDRTVSLIDSARAMSSVADRFAASYIAFGLPADFADRLRAAADDLAGFIAKRAEKNAARATATFELRGAAAEGRMMITIVDARVRPRIRNDAALLRVWETMVRSRTGRKPEKLGH